jgi:transposase
MNRTAWLQDRRMQKFRDVLSRWERKELSGQEAGEILGISERQFRRYRRRYEEDGFDGLADRRLGKASVKRVPVDKIAWLLGQYRRGLALSTSRPIRRRPQQQNPRLPATHLRIARRRISAHQGSHMHASAAMIPQNHPLDSLKTQTCFILMRWSLCERMPFPFAGRHSDPGHKMRNARSGHLFRDPDQACLRS